MSQTSRHLRRFWSSFPLSRLKQGSTLEIRSTVPITRLELRSAWRDDGCGQLEQFFGNTQTNPLRLSVFNKHQETSLGRVEPHISILLEPELDAASGSGTKQETERPDLFFSTKRPTTKTETTSSTERQRFVDHTPLKKIDRVILDDGTIHSVNDPESRAILEKSTQKTDYSDGIAHLRTESEEEQQPRICLSLQVPEKLNVVCNLTRGGNIHIENKIEGDATLTTSSGDIRVQKLRGHNVQLETDAKGTVHVSDLVEAQNASIQAGRVRVKKIYGSTVDVCTKDLATDAEDHSGHHVEPLEPDDEGSLIDISSLYVSGHGGGSLRVTNVPILARRACRIKNSHGPVRVETSNVSQPSQIDPLTNQRYPLVELGGVNGNCEVLLQDTPMADDGPDSSWTSCVVHVDSLSPDSVSLVSADKGDIGMTVDRKTIADLRLLSLPDQTSLPESSSLLAEEEDSEMVAKILNHLPAGSDGAAQTSSGAKQSRIMIETHAFTENPATPTIRNKDLSYVEGWVENKSAEPDSRFELKQGGGGGKIRVTSAADQALHGFSDSERTEDAKDDEESSSSVLRPLFAAVGTGNIRVETLSWVGAIARRYGMDDGNRGLGRTATRRGRKFAPTEDND